MQHISRKYFSTLVAILQEKEPMTKEDKKIPQTQIRVQKSHFLLWFGECTAYEKTGFTRRIKNCLTA